MTKEELEQMKQDEPNSMSPRYEYVSGWNDAIDAVAEKAPKQGEWIEVTKGIDRNTYECPFCGRLINCDRPGLKLYPFCHCGASMKKEGDENGKL